MKVQNEADMNRGIFNDLEEEVGRFKNIQFIISIKQYIGGYKSNIIYSIGRLA